MAAPASRLPHVSSLGQADALIAQCADRGTVINGLGRRVLRLLCEQGRPLGAYDLANLLNATRDHRAIVPNSVYRVLRTLRDCGVVDLIESTRAFMVRHDTGPDTRLFCVCDGCGGVETISLPEIGSIMRAAAARGGFALRQPVIEAQGLCKTCVLVL